MKTALTILFLAASATAATAQSGYSGGYYGSTPSYGTGSNPNSHYVAPHVNRSGEYTGGHYRTNPNSTTSDNYSASGNYNPHTGTTSGRRGNPW
jgi:hypothetical protein